MPEVERSLPGGGLPQGQVVELALGSSSSLGTRLCFGAIREAQRHAAVQGGEAWAAFVDPDKSLYAPAIVQAGIELERLLVVQPGPRDISRVVIQLVEARAFAVVVVDLFHVRREYSTREWSRAVRRMALATENTKAVVVLLTNAAREAGALSGLPVGMRVCLHRQAMGSVSVAITKDKQGRIRDAESVRFSAVQPSAVSPVQCETGWAKAAAAPASLGPRRGSRGSGNHPRNVRHRLTGLLRQNEPQLSLLGGA
jgi:cell division inhibitor SulA/protein ImuA